MAGYYRAVLDEDAGSVYLQNSCFDCKRTGGIYVNGDYWAGGASLAGMVSKLVANVDAETATGVPHPLAFVSDKVQVVDVALVTLVKADLVLRPVVLELPVGW
jgi:hypothetical protein